MYTARNLVNNAYKDAGVVGVGMTMSSDELNDGISWLNTILDMMQQDQLFSSTTVADHVTFDGRMNYTVGPMPDLTLNPTAQVPDFILPIMPSTLVGCVFINGNNARLQSKPCDAGVYFSRPVEIVQNPFPSEFYYERGYPLGTIRFRMGTPNCPGEILYSPSFTNVDANTVLDGFPNGLLPYMRWRLAADIAKFNLLDDTAMMSRANTALTMYQRANYKGQHYTADMSAPGATPMTGRKYNIYAPADLVGY